MSCFESQNMVLKVDDHCLLVGRIIFGILNLIDKMGFGLCKQLIRIDFFHSLHFSNMNLGMNLFVKLDKRVDHKIL
jgi:hypothetical protein